MSNEVNSTKTEEKALGINLAPEWYGTLAEIGAGQEVARFLFRVGGAAGTVAKSMSAYDMTFSDAIYGPSDRYVSRQRVCTMLDFEYGLLEERLSGTRGADTKFFAFADTVAARSYSRKQDGKGWLGIKFQHKPKAAPSQVLIHTLLLDKDTVLQQEALGTLGINLLDAVFFHHDDAKTMVKSLHDQLEDNRVDVNLISVDGPAFEGVDCRLLNLELVQQGLTHAVLFDGDGNSVEPGELLYKKPIVVQRGTFRPITHVHEHILSSAKQQLAAGCDIPVDDIAAIMEITTANLRATANFDSHDLVSRLDTLKILNKPVLISDFSEFHRLEGYLNRYSHQPIGFAIGVQVLIELFDEKYYDDLEGGLLESLGRLFKRNVRLLVYPNRDAGTGNVITANDVKLSAARQQLFDFLLESRHVIGIEDFREELFDIVSTAVLSGIQKGNGRWEQQVPSPVATLIKEQGLFSYRA